MPFFSFCLLLSLIASGADAERSLVIPRKSPLKCGFIGLAGWKESPEDVNLSIWITHTPSLFPNGLLVSALYLKAEHRKCFCRLRIKRLVKEQREAQPTC